MPRPVGRSFSRSKWVYLPFFLFFLLRKRKEVVVVVVSTLPRAGNPSLEIARGQRVRCTGFDLERLFQESTFFLTFFSLDSGLPFLALMSNYGTKIAPRRLEVLENSSIFSSSASTNETENSKDVAARRWLNWAKHFVVQPVQVKTCSARSSSSKLPPWLMRIPYDNYLVDGPLPGYCWTWSLFWNVVVVVKVIDRQIDTWTIKDRLWLCLKQQISSNYSWSMLTIRDIWVTQVWYIWSGLFLHSLPPLRPALNRIFVVKQQSRPRRTNSSLPVGKLGRKLQTQSIGPLVLLIPSRFIYQNWFKSTPPDTCH